jgi:hypothetical protein
MRLLEKLRRDPGTNFSLADIFLFAQIPNLWAKFPAMAITGYIFFRSVATGKTAKFLENLERPAGILFLKVLPKIPFLNKIPVNDFERGKPGATTLAVGLAQSVISFGSFVSAALDPFQLIGWLAAAAAGFFASFNILVGLQLNNDQNVSAEKCWKDVVKSPPFLDAAGVCCSGLMAGLATSFGWWTIIPIALALVSASLIATGKIGRVRLNKGVPMAALTAVGVLNAVVGIANGKWLAALSNAFATNGEGIVTLFYNEKYQEARPQESKSALGSVFYRE